MPKTVSIERSSIIDAPIDKVWQVTAVEFEHIDRWDGNVKSSRASESATEIAPVGGRVCNMYSGGKTAEHFVEFDANTYSFAYEIAEGLPGFVMLARNSWTHEAIAGNRTKLTMHVVMRVSGILGRLMQCPMKLQMGKVLGNAQEELKYYIETSQPHPRKRKKVNKLLDRS